MIVNVTSLMISDVEHSVCVGHQCLGSCIVGFLSGDATVQPGNKKKGGGKGERVT